jgi:hypothetical protein
VSPSSLPVGQATEVLVTVAISCAPLQVNLLSVDASGQLITILGAMHDDGMNGDAVAGDGVSSLQFTVTPPSAGELRLQASAAVSGALMRVLSPVTVVPIVGSG